MRSGAARWSPSASNASSASTIALRVRSPRAVRPSGWREAARVGVAFDAGPAVSFMDVGSQPDVDQAAQHLAVPVGVAEGDRVGLGPLEEQVGRVFPGEADAAVHLHALLGRPDRER